MPDAIVVPADVELFLCSYLRTVAADYSLLDGFEFGRSEPNVDAAVFPERLVIVRDDSGPWLSVVSQERSIGVSVLAETDKLAGDAARLLVALVRNCAAVAPGNPVAAVTESSGPYSVQEDQPRARYYATHTLVVVGESL